MSKVDLTNLRFGEYQAISELGRGATSVVYLAERTFNRAVEAAASASGDFPVLNIDMEVGDARRRPAKAAVKVVNFNDETSKLSRRFRKLFATEAWVASQLDHPNITKIFDWKVEGERAYLVMEHLEGRTLEEFITMDKLLPVQQVVDIVHKTAVALDYAHRCGIVNRDVKPANVMLCDNGEIKLMDFGLALNIKKNINIDSTYINGLGSPSYMSPEQIKGYTLNHQTDLYSLGVMFYQMLTGRLPFRAKNTASLVYKIINTDPVPVIHLNPELPEFTHEVISRAMQKDLYSRYRRGAEMAKDLSDAPYQRVKIGPVDDLDARKKILRSLPLLGRLDDLDIWELLRASSWREYPPAKVIMKQGEADKSFGIVLEGHVEIEDGAKSITIAGRGDLIGLTEWLDSEPEVERASTATALDNVVYLEVNPAALAYATEELSEEIRRIATDALLRRMRSVMRLVKQISPPAIHPAPEVSVDEEQEVAAAVENPMGWGAFANVDTLAATVAPTPARAIAPALAPRTPVLPTAPPAEQSAVPLPVPSPATTRRSSVVVQPMPVAAAAALAQFALGAAAGQTASRPAPAFDLGPVGAGQNGFVPLLVDDDDRTIPTAPDVKSVDEMAAGAVLTTEMGANFNATTAYSTTEMAANFMSTTAIDDAGSAAAEPEAGALARDFDVHSGGAATEEMAPNFAGTTAFRADDFSIPAAPVENPEPSGSGMLTSEMAPNYAGTTAFTYSDAPPDLPERPAAAVRGRPPVGLADSAEPDFKTQELAPDFAATTAFVSRDLPSPMPGRAEPTRKAPPAPAFDPEKTTILEGGFDATALPEFDGEKTVILKGGFDRALGGAGAAASAFTEELFPAIDASPVATFTMPRKSLRDVPPEDFDKTVEISGGFESQPVEDEASLDDLFPPIKF